MYILPTLPIYQQAEAGFIQRTRHIIGQPSGCRGSLPGARLQEEMPATSNIALLHVQARVLYQLVLRSVLYIYTACRVNKYDARRLGMSQSPPL